MNNNSYKYKIAAVIVLFAAVIIGVSIYIITHEEKTPSGTKKPAPSSAPDRIQASKPAAGEAFDAVIIDLVPEENLIELMTFNPSVAITCTYTGSADIRDRFDKIIAASSLSRGNFVRASLSDDGILLKLTLSSAVDVYKGVMNLVIEPDIKRMSIGSTVYRYEEDILVLNNGSFFDISSIEPEDVLNVYSLDGIVRMLEVASGHGYVSLANDEDFIGGSVTFGSAAALPIEKGRQYTVPEGSCQITVSHNKLSGTGTILVQRNQIKAFDLSPFIPEPEKICLMKFMIEPYGSALYIDGMETEYNEEIALPYGKHELTVLYTGYTTYSGSVELSKPSDSISIILSPADLTVNDGEDEDDDDYDYDDEDDEDDYEDDEYDAYPTPVG